MAKINVTEYFPSAKAPFESGKHRLWTETNITNIFKAFLDTDTTQEPVVSNDGKYLIVGGYVFFDDNGWTVSANSQYWIYIDDTTKEIVYDDNANAILYDSEPTAVAGQTAVGGKATKYKVKKSSIEETIDLNIAD